MLLNLIKDEIVGELRLPKNVSDALGPAFSAFEKALKEANKKTGIPDLDSQVVLEIAKRFTNWDAAGEDAIDQSDHQVPAVSNQNEQTKFFSEEHDHQPSPQ